MKLFTFFSFLHIGFVMFCCEERHPKPFSCKLDKELCVSIEREYKELQEALAAMHATNSHLLDQSTPKTHGPTHCTRQSDNNNNITK